MVIYSIYREARHYDSPRIEEIEFEWQSHVRPLTVFALDIHKTRAEEKIFQLPVFSLFCFISVSSICN